MTIRFRSITEADLERWYDHVGLVFAKTGRQYFVDHYRNDPWAFLEGVLIAEDPDTLDEHGLPTIASTVRVFSRRMYLRGRQVAVGAIGEVSTKPEYRRQGLSGHLLEMATDLMRERQMPLSLLWTDRFGHYGRYGWHQLLLPQVTLTVRPQPAQTIPMISLRPIDWEHDQPLLASAYEEFSMHLSCPFVRDHQDYWRDWVRHEMRASGRVLMVDGQGAGFVGISPEDFLYALGVRSAYADMLPELLSAAIAGHGRPVGAVAAVAAAAGPRLSAFIDVSQRAPQAHAMFKLVDPTAVLKAVLAGADSPLAEGGALCLRSESGATSIRSAAGRLQVAAADARNDTGPMPAIADPAVDLNDSQLLSLLLLGWDGWSAGGVTAPALDERSAARLARLFPRQDWAFWWDDAF